MPQTASTTLTQTARLQGDDSQAVAFRPQLPGVVFIQSTPPPRSSRTETGMLASLALYRPGQSTPLHHLRYPQESQALSIAHTATAADLVTPGDWTAVVTNATLTPQTFTTDVTYPIANPVMTASVDIAFLNLILAKVFDAASIQGHVQSSNRPELELSHVSLSPDVAALLKQPDIKTFHVDDISLPGLSVRIKSIDTDPAYPIVALTTDPLAVIVSLRVDPHSVKFESLGPLPLPEVRVGRISVELVVHFDGSLRVSCDADVHLNLNNLDLSDTVRSRIVGAINGLIHGSSSYAALFTPASLRQYLDDFFKAFMRLGAGAKQLSYAVRGTSLEVSYILD